MQNDMLPAAAPKRDHHHHHHSHSSKAALRHRGPGTSANRSSGGNSVSRSYRPRSRSPPSSPDPTPPRSGTPNPNGSTIREKRRSFTSKTALRGETGGNSHSGRPNLRRGETGMSTQADMSGGPGPSLRMGTFVETDEDNSSSDEELARKLSAGDIHVSTRGRPSTTGNSHQKLIEETNNASSMHRRDQPEKTIVKSSILLPAQLGVPGTKMRCSVTRRSCEMALLFTSAGLLIDRLARDLQDIQVALELSVVTGLTAAYLLFRTTGAPSETAGPSPRPSISLEHSTPAHREKRTGLPSTPALTQPSHMGAEEPHSNSIGSVGSVWATDPRDYRDCVDDGAGWALLLGPILSGSMFYETCIRLREFYVDADCGSSSHTVSSGWYIEPPLVSRHTKLFSNRRLGAHLQCSPPHTTTLALSALAASRKQACHSMCLFSLLLLAHILWSRRRLLVAIRANTTGGGLTDETRGSDYWTRRSEWQRTVAIIGFSTMLTATFVSIKILAQIAGVIGSYDYTYTDLVLSTLFFQFCLYVCVRLARRGFTLGELGIVSHAGTGLFMEVINLTRSKISIIETPFIRTYRSPTPLLIFQLALIPGSFLCGFLLSPLLVLSRRIAQRPVYRLRHPEEKQLYRKSLAAGFYIGALLICGGLIGFWVRWCLGERNPLGWVFVWITDGRKWFSRPLLISYWALLSVISVAGWTRQLNRARKRRVWTESRVTNGQHKITVVSKSNLSKTTGIRSGSAGENRAPWQRTPSPPNGDSKTSSIGGVASHMMDEMDQRLPVFSINARRKFFHALAVVMFVPGIIFDPAFTHLSFSLAFAGFIFAEYVRYFALYPFGAAVHLFLNEFLDKKDSGTAILSHFYLLTGCAGGLWLDSPRAILSLIGVFSLGVGDALASIIGKRVGRNRWSTTNGKTIEGSLAFFFSVFLAGIGLAATGAIPSFPVMRYGTLCLALSLMEAFSEQNDNLVIPVWGWCLGVCLGL